MKVLLIDDHAMFREGMKFILGDLDKTLELLEAGTLEDAIGCLEENGADLILLDLELPGTSGIDALRRIRADYAGIPLAVVSGVEDPMQIRALIEEGALGFVPKSSSADMLIAALKLIIAGGVYLPPIALNYVPPRPATAEGENTTGLLSGRQRAVLLKAIQGKPNKIIARELDIAEGTVKAHLSMAFKALGVHNRTEAVFAAAQLGMYPHANGDD